MLWGATRARLDVASLAQTAGCRPTVCQQHYPNCASPASSKGNAKANASFYRLAAATSAPCSPKRYSTPTTTSPANPSITSVPRQKFVT